MQIPRTPPPYADLLPEILARETWARLTELGLFSPTTADGRYVHWDKLRHYPEVGGVRHEHWWAAIKLARAANRKSLPLEDKEGQRFTIGSPDELQRRTSEIDRDLSGRLSLPGDVTNEATRDRYMVSALIEEAITSSQLEGAATTADVARNMLRSQRRPRDHGERMIWNNYAAMQFVREHADEPLTESLVKRIHEIVTLDTLPDEFEPGKLRTTDDVVVKGDDDLVLHRPPDHAELPARMRAMCEFANLGVPGSYLHPVVRAVLLHFWLGYDHPFPDGNGRTARALTYWSMLHSGYWLFQFVSISHILRRAPAKYARAYLYSETDENDATYFCLYQLDVIQRGITALNEYVTRKAREMDRARRLLRESGEFNHRQFAILSHALANPDATYTVRSHANSHRVTRQTARTDLNVLTERGYLTSRKAGRGLAYSPSPTLRERWNEA